jgi:flagellar protein FlaG
MNIQPAGSTLAPPAVGGGAKPAAPAGTTDATSTAAPATATPASTPSRDDVQAAVQKMNSAMLGSSQSLEFSIDEDSKDLVVKVVDQDTKEVVRQMPSKEALQIARSIEKMQQQQQQPQTGLLIDQTA